MIKLNNHRLLKPNEIIREGDFYKIKEGDDVRVVKFSIGRRAGVYAITYDFYRRKHTAKKPAPVQLRQRHPTIKPVTKKVTPARRNRTTYIHFPEPTPVAAKSVPIVNFIYNGKPREVQVISYDGAYLKGLEMNRNGERIKYQFKQYVTQKIMGCVYLDSFTTAK
jgi:hypothetical protein